MKKIIFLATLICFSLLSITYANINLVGKWIAKGGTPYNNVYIFEKDNSYSYQYDDYFEIGTYTYKDGVIKLISSKQYIGEEEMNMKKNSKIKIKKKTDGIIEINNIQYKNIDAINENENWYMN